MRYLVTGSQMKAIDRNAIEQVGIPSVVLMERAAMAVADAVVRYAEGSVGLAESGRYAEGCVGAGRKAAWGEGAGRGENAKNRASLHIWAVCGSGNNGADGIAAARLLHNKGYQVTVILAGGAEHGTEEFYLQRRIALNLDIPVTEWKDFLPGRCDILIDAVFGVGLSRPVEGDYARVLQMMKDCGAGYTVAVDMPSGIHSDSGQIMGTAVPADVTVTFGYKKLGSALYPGRDYCGRVEVCDIGFPPDSVERISASFGVPAAVTYGPEDLDKMPERPSYSNKGTFGKVLVAAGSENMGGAAYLSALAAYRTGAGLVKIMTAAGNRQMMQQLLPEAILSTYEADEPKREPEAFHRKVEEACAWADVIVLGPGIGQRESMRELLREFLINAYVPIVLDADGLNLIARYPELTQYYTENIIITPHLGEMSRLTGLTTEQLRRDIVAAAVDYSGAHGITCVLKDSATVAAGRDGQRYVNSSGNSAMAKAGSGDVLTGVIAGLLAQGCELWEAAALGVYLHGMAGDRLRAVYGSQGILARELADEVGRIRAGEPTAEIGRIRAGE